jgi:hypothetical protein
VCPVKAPADRRAAVSKAISRANYGLGAGNFEMSFEDGTIRYRNGIYAGDEQLSVELARHAFYIANSTMDDYFAAFMAVIYGDAPPQLAVVRAEEAIHLRGLVSSDQTAAEETPPGGAATSAPEPINQELAALLASLSSELDERPDSEDRPTAENRTLAEFDDGTRVEHLDDAT